MGLFTSCLFSGVFMSSLHSVRPQRNTLQAVLKSLNYVNSGYQHIVEIDLKGFFDEVDHCLLLDLLYRKIKCPVTMQLIRRWLRAPIWVNGKLMKRRKGVPQEGGALRKCPVDIFSVSLSQPAVKISPLLSNIMLHELDTEMERQGLRFVRYAEEFSIYCKTKSEAREKGNKIYLFLRDKLKLPINREKVALFTSCLFSMVFMSSLSLGSAAGKLLDTGLRFRTYLSKGGKRPIPVNR